MLTDYEADLAAVERVNRLVQEGRVKYQSKNWPDHPPYNREWLILSLTPLKPAKITYSATATYHHAVAVREGTYVELTPEVRKALEKEGIPL